MSTYKVHNLREGSRPAPAGYDSWIDYWRKKSGKAGLVCYATNCSEPAVDGAHVQIKDSDDSSWYITPLCHKCNCQFGKDFQVVGPLVPVDSSKPIKW